MVDFGGGNYFHAMDKFEDEDMQLNKGQLMSMGEFGSSARMGDVLQSLKGELSAGASHVELVFSGKGKGSLGGQQTTPEMFDRQKRQAIRELSKLNDVTLSTHASVAISGVAGFQQNQFSDRAKNDTLIEIKRTIDFAADTAQGGAVVVHTNEFPREVQDKRFQLGSEEQETIYLADKETGKIMGFEKGKILHMPKWKRNASGDYVDDQGQVITDYRNLADRAPETDSQGELVWDEVTYSDLKKDVQRWNDGHQHDAGFKHRLPEKEFLFQQAWQQIEQEKPRTAEYWREYKQSMKTRETLMKDLEGWKHLEKSTPKDRHKFLREVFKRDHPDVARAIKAMGNDEEKMPSEMLVDFTQRLKEQETRLREGYIGFKKHERDLQRLHSQIDTVEQVGVDRSADTFAKAAMYAYEIEKEKGLDKAIFLAPENMFAEWGYGGHPDELAHLVRTSRKKFQELLMKQKGMDKKQAKKVAADHIKATWDVGHANTWSKFFEQDPNLSPTQNKQKFDKWMLSEVKRLQKEGILGHVHMSDNFGYFDEHLSIGGGNAPIREFVKTMKDAGYEGDLVVEWGAQGPDEASGANLAAWANLARSPIYRVQGAGAPAWRDIEHSGYFGRASSPMHVVGQYASKMSKDWNLWSYSEAPIE